MKENRESDVSIERNMKKASNSIKWIALLALLLVVAIVVFVVSSSFLTGEAIAVVNGEEISEQEFSERMDRVLELYKGQGLDVQAEGVEEGLREQVLNQLVDETLILQKAEEQGIEVSEEEVTEAINADLASIGIAEPSEDQLQELLSEAGISETLYRENMTTLVTITKYLDSVIPVEVEATEAEVQELYSQYAEATENPEPLANIRDAVEDQITAQKRATLIQDHVAELRAGADIVINSVNA